MSDDSTDDFEQLPEDVALAVEIIRQIENLGYDADTVLKAMSHICLDTLAKLSEEDRLNWQKKLCQSLASN
ncbi:hypothetical protein EOPP23_10950 [Endozoicomonas sp. OPT23]|uniref:hypothetical protein n=1 Tax=Endozoicomonas sp. OPT23 TaxID=2072845 RepID=UPI00129B3114|nr:hypothetical protein [Endozoicomonas sp. OPT23]MRI33503.1 hypothetical protein [Endozoicomonas sp. OPT23]